MELCEVCEPNGRCASRTVIVPSVEMVRDPHLRLRHQNYIVDLGLSYHRLPDVPVDAMRDYYGTYLTPELEIIPTPGIGCLLSDGIEWWFRENFGRGKWRDVSDVPSLRLEATGRWRVIGTAINIFEGGYACPGR
mgnify:FL=1